MIRNNNEKDIIFCPICKKFKSKYKGTQYCQYCYRKLLEEYSNYDYLYRNEEDRKKYMSDNARKICKLLVEDGIRDKKKIAEMVNLNFYYVRSIIGKYTMHVNSDGEVRPF